MTWEPLHPFGCSIEADLSSPLSSEQQSELRFLFERHLLLRFRGQQISPDDQVRAMDYLGSVLRFNNGRDYEYVSNLRADGKLGSDAISWHCDMQFSPLPFEALSLYATVVPNGKTSTRFASGARAYEELTEHQREMARGLEALNVFASEFAGRNRLTRLSPHAPSSIHPVVRNHIVTGVPYLFASWQQTDSIVGVGEEESDQILDQLFTVLYHEDNIVEHRWSEGDLVIWDNQSLQHARGDVANVGERTLRKVIIAQKSLMDMYPEFTGQSSDQMRQATARSGPLRTSRT